MKYRLGFVTNSSSTSFLIVFDNEKKLEEDRELYKSWYPEINIDLLFDEIEENIITMEQMENNKYFYDYYDIEPKELAGKIVSNPHFGNEACYPVFEHILNDVLYGLALSQCSHH